MTIGIDLNITKPRSGKSGSGALEKCHPRSDTSSDHDGDGDNTDSSGLSEIACEEKKRDIFSLKKRKIIKKNKPYKGLPNDVILLKEDPCVG